MELINNRRVRNIILSLGHKTVKMNQFKQVLRRQKVRLKRYYDETSKKLPKLVVEERGKIHQEGMKNLTHRSSIIIGEHAHPRSYRVKTENVTETLD